jgi:hypothetical protein
MMAANNPNNKKKTPERIENIRTKYKTHAAYDKENTNDAEIVDTRKQNRSKTNEIQKRSKEEK